MNQRRQMKVADFTIFFYFTDQSLLKAADQALADGLSF